MLALCAGEKAEILKEQEEADAEGKEELEEELEDIDEIQDHITDITSHLLKTYGGRVEAMVVNNLMPEFYKSLTSQKNQKMVVSSIAFFNSVLPYCSLEIFNKGYDQISPLYIQLAASTDLTIKQNVLFGLGNFATKAQASQYANALQVAVHLSSSIMNEPDAKNLNKINSYETAVGALGKLGLFQGQKHLVETFLTNLPLQHEDAQDVHMMLLEQVPSTSHYP